VLVDEIRPVFHPAGVDFIDILNCSLQFNQPHRTMYTDVQVSRMVWIPYSDHLSSS
jgi:hypothetical protein